MMGPVTLALCAMRREPELPLTGRRTFLRAVAALPLVGAYMGALSTAEAATTPEHETRFLALVPWLAEVVPPAKAARRTSRRLYDEADYNTREGGRSWEQARPILEANGYYAAADRANELDAPIAEAFEPFRGERMTTLTALAWKARIDILLGGDGEDIVADLAALAGRA